VQKLFDDRDYLGAVVGGNRPTWRRSSGFDDDEDWPLPRQ